MAECCLPLALIYTYFKKSCRQNDKCQWSNSDCTTEKKCGYWILIGNNPPWCRLHIMPTFDVESWFVHIHQDSAAEASFFLGICKRTVERYSSKFLVNGHVKPGPVGHSYDSTGRTHCFCIPNMEKPQFLSVVQFPFDNCHSPFSLTIFSKIGAVCCVEWLALRKVQRLWITSKATLWHWNHLYLAFVSTYVNSRYLTRTPTNYYFYALIYK